jgi:hypothetical protein
LIERQHNSVVARFSGVYPVAYCEAVGGFADVGRAVPTGRFTGSGARERLGRQAQ